VTHEEGSEKSPDPFFSLPPPLDSKRNIRRAALCGSLEQENKQEGKQESLILLLEKKFGKLGDVAKRNVRQIQSAERFESLLLAVLDADSLEDLPL
jgi:hypothetical protein